MIAAVIILAWFAASAVIGLLVARAIPKADHDPVCPNPDDFQSLHDASNISPNWSDHVA